MPATRPAAPIVAIAVLLLLHEPPVVSSLNVIVFPTHTTGVLSTGEIGLTVIIAVAVQPVDNA